MSERMGGRHLANPQWSGNSVEFDGWLLLAMIALKILG
jgi:hypothetical protein